MNHVYNKVIRKADDASVALKIRIPNASTTGTITLSNNTTLAYVVDTASGTYDLTTTAYATLGGLADALNAVSGIEAVIVDGRRANSTNAKLTSATTAAQTATAAAGVTLLWDTSATNWMTVAVQEEDLPSLADTAGKSDVEDKAIENVAFEVKCKNTNSSATGTLNVYKCHGTTETLIHSITATATSSEQTLFTSENVPLSAGDPEVGGRLVLELVQQTGGGVLEVRGQSINRVRQAIDGD